MEASPVRHIPVMRDAVLELLACRPGGRYVDGTLGGGGYSQAILEASAPDGVVLALDWDAEAVERAGHGLGACYGRRLVLRRASFAELASVMAELEWEPVDGIVLDLGVSSVQLDQCGRGFSFRRDGPLDMRMDQRRHRTAADLVNSLSESDLSEVIARLGEEKWARRIARAIVSHRECSGNPFRTTRELAELIERVVPRTKDSRRIHPATRTFQALRLAVNHELEELEGFLDQVLNLLRPGGRLCIVAFHSLEDRIVKERFKHWARSCRCPRSLPQCRCEGRSLVRLLTRKVRRPEPEEMERNPRARSARLRALEKLECPEAIREREDES